MTRSITVVFVLSVGCITPTLAEQCASNPIYSLCGSADGPEVQACCNLTQCELRVADGHTYVCEGTDCTAASAELSAHCGQLCAPPDMGVNDAGVLDASDAGDADLDAGDASDVGLDVGLDAPPCLR